ncbi:MAG: GNAT family N-acetyltransferase [Methanobrevibacter sp.]|nr:GNAT family N-acetyltransferase [Methanobrevibacter sp.]
MHFKKLVGKKCYLSPNDTGDAEKFTKWLNDLEVIVNLDIYSSVINLEIENALLDKLSKDHNYSIIDNSSNELIGTCGFIELDHLNQTAEIGIFIGNKNYWNKGYGTEALSLLIDYGFNALNIHNIMLRVYEFNKEAIKLYEKVGFKRIGKRREALHRNMEKHDIIYMDVLPIEFYKINNKLLKSSRKVT